MYFFCGLRLTADQQNNPSKYTFVTDDRYTFVSYLGLSLGYGYFWMRMEEEDLQKDCCQVMGKNDGDASSNDAPLTCNKNVELSTKGRRTKRNKSEILLQSIEDGRQETKDLIATFLLDKVTVSDQVKAFED